MVKHVPAGELELRRGRELLDASAVTDSLNALPGFKTSAAFFTFLRANLVLPASNMSSNTSTPLLDPSSSSMLPQPSPSPLSSSQTLEPTPNPLDGVPPLTTLVLTDPKDRVDALKLVADSVAQQRQAASWAVISNPFILGLWVLIISMVCQYMYKSRDDIGLVLTTSAGITMAMLVAVRIFSADYLSLAEKMTWAFLKNPFGEDDILIGSKFGDEVIGATVLRLESIQARRKSKNAKGGKGMIRAWTVKLRFRHKGVGTGLLEETVRVTRERLGNNAGVGFSKDHANSKMILPPAFNGRFRKREIMAVKKLEEVERSEASWPKKKK
ncbi:MAG: hypothetical protein M1818_004334 [Claussenomyces sp. TS43310]|nr:MAG: hypothetical protein M1818_004334 [Claussenomyces sp. TS43310]